jgi:hypothetical protein
LSGLTRHAGQQTSWPTNKLANKQAGQQTSWPIKKPPGNPMDTLAADFLILQPLAAKSGAAARLAKTERATALATDDLGQRVKLVPLPE